MVEEAWPSPPAVWSFSALRDARECPRRWALRRQAQAPSPRGAPTGTPGRWMGAQRGRICHAVLQRMLDTHRVHDGPRWGSPELQRFWKQHFPGGIIGLVREAGTRELSRVSAGADPAALQRRELDALAPTLTGVVAALLRLALSRTDGPAGATITAEVPVEADLAPGVRWRGCIDAVIVQGADVTLVDFKTGAPSPTDVEQLMAYACMHALDEQTARHGVVRRLAALYADGGVSEREAPTGEGLMAERVRLVEETERVARRLRVVPPEASPSEQWCPRCEVRGGCDDYWIARRGWAAPPSSAGSVVDLEARVAAVLARGRALRLEASGGTVLALLEPTLAEFAVALTVGARVRVMGARVVPSAEVDDAPRAELAIEVGHGGLVASSA